MSLIGQLKNFDAYTKPIEDFRVRTFSGGAVTLLCSLLILVLFITETVSFLSGDIVEQLYVDWTPGDQRIEINFDIKLYKLPCLVLSLDLIDMSGDSQDDISDDIFKIPLDSSGNEMSQKSAIKQIVNDNNTATPSAVSRAAPKCGSCYGASEECCNSCDDVKEAYMRRGWQLNDIEIIEQCQADNWLQTLGQHNGEGCRIFGKVQVPKVAGNLHIAPGESQKSFRSHFHDLHMLTPGKFDTSHEIVHLSFGTQFTGKEYPLDGKAFGVNKDSHGVMHQYFVKLVPTMHTFIDQSKNVFSHQFSVNTYEKNIAHGASGLPGIFIQYEFSPLMIKYEERRQPLSTFIVSLCAIIGGIFTVASLVDALIYNSSRVLQHKIMLNKFS